MNVNDDQNYVIGRGRLFFDKFLDNTKTPTGERYFGNTPAFTLSTSVNTLDHYSSEQGTKEKDLSVNLSVDNTITITCDNIDDDNLALWFLGSTSAVTVGAATGDTSVFESVTLGSYFQVGITDDTPAGVSDIDNVTIENNNGAHAAGTITYSAVEVANDTLVINGVTITWKASGATGNQVNIGTDAPTTAAAMNAFINAHSLALGVSATVAADVVTITANEGGTAGNSIGLVKTGSVQTVSGATLTGGAAGTTIDPAGYDADLVNGRIYLHPDAAGVTDGDSITVTYDVAAQTQALVLAQGKAIYGALRFIAENAVGANKNVYVPYCKLSPNGDYNLKGDDWQQVQFTLEALRRDPVTEKIIKY